MGEYFIVVLLDENRLSKIKGTDLEKHIKYMFGGELRLIEVPVNEELKNKILQEFDTARVDSRGAITDLPVAFMRELFNQIVEKKSLGPEVIEAVLQKVDEIKEAAAKESEYLPPPEID
ncbi:hypothetical protein Thein_1169 [Thermodesulfatator indicus DSM 15286]|uniref:Uncharacterized protein n=1 Tax=Thermodesulfatator indicus (strain DSM 15286 / JCM 11887 / CIR29812) TaxID=667014 RepID=F8A842_THEID|nr:hypothetical protein [Thermodesulfatator indicus]AEH45037.1 hypothetical protein Thein_1169 [Thermodesulfatator indicus DSM 15286]